MRLIKQKKEEEGNGALKKSFTFERLYEALALWMSSRRLTGRKRTAEMVEKGCESLALAAFRFRGSERDCLVEYVEVRRRAATSPASRVSES